MWFMLWRTGGVTRTFFSSLPFAILSLDPHISGLTQCSTNSFFASRAGSSVVAKCAMLQKRLAAKTLQIHFQSLHALAGNDVVPVPTRAQSYNSYVGVRREVGSARVSTSGPNIITLSSHLQDLVLKLTITPQLVNARLRYFESTILDDYTSRIYV
jgi:hypothetical protein